LYDGNAQWLSRSLRTLAPLRALASDSHSTGGGHREILALHNRTTAYHEYLDALAE